MILVLILLSSTAVGQTPAQDLARELSTAPDGWMASGTVPDLWVKVCRHSACQGYRISERQFYLYDFASQQWVRMAPPNDLPPLLAAIVNDREKPETPLRDKNNFGLDVGKLGSTTTRYSLNGREVSRAEAVKAVESDSLTDDSHKLRLSVIGSAEACKQVAEDVERNPAFADIRDQFHFQSYRPDNPMVAALGLPAGSPTVYLQESNGKVIAREDHYPGAEQVAGLIRRRHPHYDPARDNGFSLFRPRIDLGKMLPPWAPTAGLILLGLLIARVLRK